jgi:hypothetical protein
VGDRYNVKLANVVFCDTVRRIYKGVLYFKKLLTIPGTVTSVISCIHTRKARLSCSDFIKFKGSKALYANTL